MTMFKRQMRILVLRACLVAGFALAIMPLGAAAAAIPGTWSSTGSMSVGHWLHTATLLRNGEVLVAGGFDYASGTTATAELYDPTQGTWSRTGSTNAGRWGHRAALLSNGNVLVVGGSGLATAEVYNPASGTWTYTGSMNDPRNDATLTPLTNGKVLVAGGYNYVNGLRAIQTVELYDPTSGTWTYTGPMSTPRADQTATLLPSGQILVAGGTNFDCTTTCVGGAVATAELYDPSSGTWASAGSMNTARQDQTATLLANGETLVAGGRGADVGILASAELYNPATNTWSMTGTMTAPRVGHTATLLTDGTVLVAGGGGTPGSAEVYDPASGSWNATASMSADRYVPTATLLPDGQVLVAGGLGASNSALASAELYTPVAVLLTNMSQTVAAGLSSGGIFGSGASGIATSLQQQIAAVQADVVAGNTAQTLLDLQTFACHVHAQSSKSISTPVATTLVTDAQAIYLALGGTSPITC